MESRPEPALADARTALVRVLSGLLFPYRCRGCNGLFPAMFALIAGGYGCNACLPALIAGMLIDHEQGVSSIST